MASSYPPPLEGPVEVKEGFLCPLCLKDLQSFYQLQDHYEEEHSGEERHVRGQIKSLVQKAKKAKDKLLKRDGEDRNETSYESFYYGGVDPYMWEPQELGATRNHVDFFKKHRAERIDHYVVEVNKRIIRLEKLTSFDRTNMDAGKIRALEKSVVSWVNDSDVPFCPDCGGKFNIRNRRHHCRLCGSIMCRKCMEFVTLPLAYKLTSGTREALSAPAGSPGQKESSGSGVAVVPSLPRRGSISSLSSVSSVLEERDDDRIRCCHHCMDTLLKRQEKLEEKDHVPDIVKLYEKLRLCMDKVDEKAPEYIRMAESLNAGETTYNLDTAGGLRMEVQKYYELIDALSKRIMTLGVKEEPQPHPKTLQLQRMVRYSATLFVQEKLLGLMSLPTKDKYEELKEKRREEQERRLQQERQAALENQKRRSELDRTRSAANTNGEAPASARPPRMTKAGGWLPSSDALHTRQLDDPLLQQIDNIQSFLRQARAAGRADEAAVLEENLRQLQDEYDLQQTSRAIELSKRLAEEESLQQDQLERLEWKERAQGVWRDTGGYGEEQTTAEEEEEEQGEEKEKEKEEEEKEEDEEDKRYALARLSASPPRATTIKSFPPLGESPPTTSDQPPSLNPFDEEDSTPVEEDDSNPFAEDIQREQKAATANGRKEYNPFEEEEEGAVDEGAETKQESPAGRNPFEEDEDERNPFKEGTAGTPGTPSGASKNPFDDNNDEDDASMACEIIEEELLRQQIDNIRAYIFDAKQNGRADEVELLSENLRELQRTLQEQKRKAR
ncbi:rabenosyn-5 [Sardina pilchardus]|uniref:rabenosyn-5 n=1 Tax=Sardina pilchardus TaxID=27697 RepID=UPI002E0FC995